MINYTMSIDNIANIVSTRGMNQTPSLQVSKVYEDGTFLNIEEEQILMHLIEENGFLYGDSLELEVFMYEVTGSATAGTLTFTEELKPLKFVKREDQIKNGILMTKNQDDFRYSRRHLICCSKGGILLLYEVGNTSAKALVVFLPSR